MATERILIADDDAALAKALSMRLRHAGFDVVHAADAYQALQMARREQPDLLLLDIHMPAGDGFSVQQRIGRIEGIEGIPVIYLTGDSSEAVDRTAEKIGAFAVLHKPIDKRQLIDTVRAALGYFPSGAKGLSGRTATALPASAGASSDRSQPDESG